MRRDTRYRGPMRSGALAATPVKSLTPGTPAAGGEPTDMLRALTTGGDPAFIAVE